MLSLRVDILKGEQILFIAMNRFRIAIGHESDFEEIWQNRESYLEEVAGFNEFHLLKGPSDEEATL